VLTKPRRRQRRSVASRWQLRRSGSGWSCSDKEKEVGLNTRWGRRRCAMTAEKRRWHGSVVVRRMLLSPAWEHSARMANRRLPRPGLLHHGEEAARAEVSGRRAQEEAAMRRRGWSHHGCFRGGAPRKCHFSGGLGNGEEDKDGAMVLGYAASKLSSSNTQEVDMQAPRVSGF
jgi:hypothetical protein